MCYNVLGDTMKDLIKIAFMICLVVVVYIYRNNIANFITEEIIYRGSNKVLTYNEYYLDYDYSYVQNIDTEEVKNYQDVLNMIYTILNSGDDSYSFKCGYTDCINDVKKLVDDADVLTNINNLVHPFNSFSTINVSVANSGKITVNNKKAYSDSDIEYIKDYINNFINNNINNSMGNYDKIKVFHDNIVNSTEYDVDNTNKTYTAYDLLTTGKAICGGYSDIMAIYLNTLGIQNYKITSDNHVWNLVKLDDVWYHLDMTWDDPVASDGNQYLLHNFFLISTDKLLELDKIEHNFDKNVYKEAS